MIGGELLVNRSHRRIGVFAGRKSFQKVQPVLCRCAAHRVNSQESCHSHVWRDELPQPCSLVRCPRQDLPLFPRISPFPCPIRIEFIGDVLQTCRAFENHNIFLRFGVEIFQRRNIAFWMDGRVPLICCLYDRHDVGALQFFG